jgi:hypothetical protein
MQPDYTYALVVKDRRDKVVDSLAPNLAYNSTSGCLIYMPRQPERLIKLASYLETLAILTPTSNLQRSEILAELFTSNSGYLRTMSANSQRLVRLCGAIAELLLTAGEWAPSTYMHDALSCT